MPRRWFFDPDDPRAPSHEQWERMTPAEREHVVACLSAEIPKESLPPPEGDQHEEARTRARDALRQYFRTTKRQVYLGSDLPIYYPDDLMIAPDLIAVRDVELRPRLSWIVETEGRGIEFALEIRVAGNYRKDFELNVMKYASLGILEYFAFDMPSGRLVGWRLPHPSAAIYEPIAPHAGKWESAILELELAVDDGRLRFFHGSAPLLDSQELIAQMGTMVDAAVRRAEDETRRAEEQARRAEGEARRAQDEALRAQGEARRAEEEARRAEEEARRAEAEARRADRLAHRLRELGVDPETI